jgi:hypothetical protein
MIILRVSTSILTQWCRLAHIQKFSKVRQEIQKFSKVRQQSCACLPAFWPSDVNWQTFRNSEMFTNQRRILKSPTRNPETSKSQTRVFQKFSKVRQQSCVCVSTSILTSRSFQKSARSRLFRNFTRVHLEQSCYWNFLLVNLIQISYSKLSSEQTFENFYTCTSGAAVVLKFLISQSYTHFV